MISRILANKTNALYSIVCFVLLIVIYSCTDKSETDDNKIYTDDREWTFKVAFKDATGKVADTCTLKLQVGEKSLASIMAGQKGIAYVYDNCDEPVAYKETTGVDESEEGIFLHSPRLGAFAFTEVIPFPTINYPAELKTSSEIELKVIKSTFKPAENKTIKQILERTITDTITYKGAKLVCFIVEGKNTNYIKEIGQYTGTYWFNEQYGFVRLLYKKPDGSTIDLVLTDTNF